MEKDQVRLKCMEALEQHSRGNWQKAHELIQDYSDPLACWIHAMLHREEGDEFNANYWYTRASMSFNRSSIEEEREQIKSVIDSGG